MAALDPGAQQQRGAVDLSRYFDPDTGELDWLIAQAEGMISGQAAVPMAGAVIALDDYCRAHCETRHAVAVQVTEGWLRFGR
jgi:hypothetical protein